MAPWGETIGKKNLPPGRGLEESEEVIGGVVAMAVGNNIAGLLILANKIIE